MSVALALVWHQHQPYYKDIATGELAMPWVRLHGVKDYYGMARLLEQHPGVKATVNLVPSLVDQLLEYVNAGASDPYLHRTEIPAADLKGEDACFILDHFFHAQWDRMIRVYPRFGELLHMRRMGQRSVESALGDFAERDLRDLQVWFNLAWFHPVSFEESETLRELRKKGRDFSEADKAAMLKVHREVLARVVPLHAELAQRGQLELTATPFYHPILPLLCDMESARVAMPGTALPEGHCKNEVDAEAHVAKAVAFHKRVFGVAPEGMWPAEGSVSPAILPLLQRQGIRWFATDEEILGHSLGERLRGNFGKLERPDLLYRPWLVRSNGAELQAVFRDHEFSDLVGFQYQGWDGRAAAEDFLGRIGRAGHSNGGERPMVSVILDGENCWEHYPEQGIGFLREFYGRLQDRQHGIESVRVADHLKAHPPTRAIERLYSGSWINHDFYIWIGHEEDRRAWEYVYRVREDLERETRARGEDAHRDPHVAKAWESLYVAEGSDWYWWFGDDHTSGIDDQFDRLFRKHLKNVYGFLNLSAPYFLDEPVAQTRYLQPFTQPKGRLEVTLDGRITSYFEWIGAGRYRPDRDGGVMTAQGAPLVAQVYFGYATEHLCVRVDFHEPETPGDDKAAKSSAKLKAESPDDRPRRVALHFAEPKGLKLSVEAGPPAAVRREGAWPGSEGGASGSDGTEAAWDEVLELRVPFQALGIERGQPVAFYLEAVRANGVSERLPRGGALHFTVPSRDADAYDWMV